MRSRPCLRLSLTCVLALGVCGAGEVITEAEIAGIECASLADDDGWVAPIAADLVRIAGEPARLGELDAFRAAFATWPPTQGRDASAMVFPLLNAVALADLGRSSCEAEIAHVVFTHLLAQGDRTALLQAAARLALDRDPGVAVAGMAHLGLAGDKQPQVIRDRMRIYARKLVGRLLGKLPVKTEE